jgi:HPt (histidine-containing phosphotransfer) domain-containing protein
MAQVHTDAECIYSRLGGDPDLGDIVGMFVEELPKRVTALLDHLSKGDWEGLQRGAHQIKGAAGSYGFDSISPVAGRLELAVRNGEPEDKIRVALAELSDLCGRARYGQPPSGG